MYVNRIFYGNFAVGVGSAAQLYFLEPASKLDLAQASMLAGLPQSPSAYNPLVHDANEAVNPLAKNRQKAVLQAMQASGYITQAQGIAAFNEKLTFHAWDEPQSEPNLDLDFIDYLQTYLNANFPQYASPGGYEIRTTIDQAKQDLAYTTVHNLVSKERIAENMGDGALVSLNPQNGEVLAMVGTWNYADPYFGQVNEAAAVQLNMGSTTKLFTYTAAIASTKFTMTTPILDSRYPFPIPGAAAYNPYDDDRRTHGICELKLCLGNSFNIPAVKTEYATGTQYIANTELAMGVTSLNQNCGFNGRSYVNWPTLTQWAATLGSLTCGITLLDLADGAATLGDLGVQHNPMPVTSITAQATGQIVWTYNPTAAGHQVIPANVAYIMDEITSNDNNRIREFGRNGYLTLNPRRVSAKTGTADFFMDNLTVGWTPNLLTAVWVGNAQRSCLQPKDYTYMKNQIARGNIVEAGEVDNTYPFSPNDLAKYGLKPLHPSYPGLRPPRRRRLRIQRRCPDLARVHVGGAQGRSGYLVQAARRRHRRNRRRPRRRRRLLSPRHPARRVTPTARTTARHPPPPRPAPTPDRPRRRPRPPTRRRARRLDPARTPRPTRRRPRFSCHRIRPSAAGRAPRPHRGRRGWAAQGRLRSGVDTRVAGSAERRTHARGRRPRCGAPAGPRPRRGRGATTSSRGSRRTPRRAPLSVRAAGSSGFSDSPPPKARSSRANASLSISASTTIRPEPSGVS